jgi:hypothetical protein
VTGLESEPRRGSTPTEPVTPKASASWECLGDTDRIGRAFVSSPTRCRLLAPEEAFTALRGYARTHNHRLSDLSRQVIDGTADVIGITTHAAR